MAETEIDILGEAFAGTEKEIFGESAGTAPEALDDSGDRSVEDMGEGLEGQHEADEAAEGEETPEEAEASGTEQVRDEKTGRFVEKEPKADPKDTPELKAD